jgi:hypothetical protein
LRKEPVAGLVLVLVAARTGLALRELLESHGDAVWIDEDVLPLDAAHHRKHHHNATKTARLYRRGLSRLAIPRHSATSRISTPFRCIAPIFDSARQQRNNQSRPGLACMTTDKKLPHQKRPREISADDPRQLTDWPNTRQTDEPWKGNPEKEQFDPNQPDIDLERWHESSTH